LLLASHVLRWKTSILHSRSRRQTSRFNQIDELAQQRFDRFLGDRFPVEDEILATCLSTRVRFRAS
jgi:hypothetical protein